MFVIGVSAVISYLVLLVLLVRYKLPPVHVVFDLDDTLIDHCKTKHYSQWNFSNQPWSLWSADGKSLFMRAGAIWIPGLISLLFGQVHLYSRASPCWCRGVLHSMYLRKNEASPPALDPIEKTSEGISEEISASDTEGCEFCGPSAKGKQLNASFFSSLRAGEKRKQKDLSYVSGIVLLVDDKRTNFPKIEYSNNALYFYHMPPFSWRVQDLQLYKFLSWLIFYFLPARIIQGLGQFW